VNRAKSLLNRYRIYSIAYSIAVLAVILLIAQNNFSLIFDHLQIMERFGDQRLYIDLADNLLHMKIEPHVYSIGYPLFIAPFVFLAKTTNWKTISGYIVAVQSLLLFPSVVLILLAIFKKFIGQANKFLKMIAVGISVFFIFYELFLLFHSADPLTFYLFFGLIPYSEMVAIFTIILANGIFIIKDFKLSKIESAIVGFLLSFSVMIRITYVFLAFPIILFYLINFFHKKESRFFFGALFIGYLPQLFYNYIAYGNIFSSGYLWYWKLIRDQYIEPARNIYHTNNVQMFSAQYLKINVFLLFRRYVHFLLVILIGIYLMLRKRAKINKDNLYFFLLINTFSLVYLIVLLSYLWSPIYDAGDRFLLPLSFISLISIFYTVSLYAKKDA
jgi:hypothetical protein